jgi:hypothetical protein
MTRAKAKWHCKGERNFKLFLNLEKKHYTEKTIQRLVTDQGKEVTDIKDIIKEQVNFYQSLNAPKNNTSDPNKEKLFSAPTKLK